MRDTQICGIFKIKRGYQMDEKKNIHVRISMEVLGEEGMDITLKYNFTSLELVKKIQAALAAALLGLNG
jgi:hypothetical protein